MNARLAIARRLLDRRLAVSELVQQVGPIPARGWVREIRTALGMSSQTLGTRSRMSPTRVRECEKAEIDRTIRLKTLDRLAEAMDCSIFYAIVPRQSLENIVWQQAHRKAVQELQLRAPDDCGDQQHHYPEAMVTEALVEELTLRTLELLDNR